MRTSLYRAFRELGRVQRTLFLLWLIPSTPGVRRTIRAETTKIEAYTLTLRKSGKPLAARKDLLDG